MAPASVSRSMLASPEPSVAQPMGLPASTDGSSVLMSDVAETVTARPMVWAICWTWMTTRSKASLMTSG